METFPPLTGGFIYILSHVETSLTKYPLLGTKLLLYIKLYILVNTFILFFGLGSLLLPSMYKCHAPSWLNKGQWVGWAVGGCL